MVLQQELQLLLKSKSMLNVADICGKAIQINPDNHRAYHILGRWHYEVSKLSWVIKKLSKLVFRHSPMDRLIRLIILIRQ